RPTRNPKSGALNERFGRRSRLATLCCRQQFLPEELAAFSADAPFKPGFMVRIPTDPMDRHGVQQFVGKDNPAHAAWRQHFPRTEPANVPVECVQLFPLPTLPTKRLLQNPVFQFLE